MRFGLIIRGQYPQGDDMRVRLKEDLDAAKFAEDLGYDCIGKGSHYSSHPFQYIQQIPYLCQVAMIAPKLRLIPGVVLLPLHSPLHVAEELASLDVMCDGKLVFGAGIGYREVEFNAFGTTTKQSGQRFEECLTAVKRLWQTGDHALNHQVAAFKASVQPVGQPHMAVDGGPGKAQNKAGNGWKRPTGAGFQPMPGADKDCRKHKKHCQPPDAGQLRLLLQQANAQSEGNDVDTHQDLTRQWRYGYNSENCHHHAAQVLPQIPTRPRFDP